MKKNEEKVNPITLTMEETGEVYTLEFDRATVRYAEKQGFKISEIDDRLTTIYDLFHYAFRKHHPTISRETTEGIIDNIWGGIFNLPEGLLERLGKLYVAPFSTLSDGEIEKNYKKVTVKL